MDDNIGVVTVRDFNSRVSDFQDHGVSGPTGVTIDTEGRRYVAGTRTLAAPSGLALRNKAPKSPRRTAASESGTAPLRLVNQLLSGTSSKELTLSAS